MALYTPGKRVWGSGGTRCNECCNGDRCDDPTHYSREHCPHCMGTGQALWTDEGQAEYIADLCQRGRMSEQEALAYVQKLKGGAA